MQDLVETYIAEHPDAGYEELQEQFGSPEELAASLVDNLTSEEVLRLFKRRKWWGIAVVRDGNSGGFFDNSRLDKYSRKKPGSRNNRSSYDL